MLGVHERHLITTLLNAGDDSFSKLKFFWRRAVCCRDSDSEAAWSRIQCVLPRYFGAGADNTTSVLIASETHKPTRLGTWSHFVTQRPSDPRIQRPGHPVDPVTLSYNELQMSTYVGDRRLQWARGLPVFIAVWRLHASGK